MMLKPILIIIFLIIVAYLIGSISSAVWVGKRFYGLDIREHGSKNAGATNMLRVLGRRAALPVFAFDFAKGAGAVMLYNLSPYKGTDFEFYLKLILAVAVVLGHIFPIFSNFKGGKGVATLAGAVLAINPLVISICAVIFFVVLAISHYVSLSSMTAGIMFPILSFFIDKDIKMLIFGTAVAVLLIYTHRKNVGRILAGTESKIYFKPNKYVEKRAKVTKRQAKEESEKEREHEEGEE